jgi:hypothetical protein
MATPPDFSSGAVLTAAQMNSVGLWLVKTQTIGTAVSSVTVTSAFSADYDNYKIIISGGASTTQDFLAFRLGTGTSSAYYGFFNYGNFASNLNNGAGQNNNVDMTYAGGVDINRIHMNLELQSPFLAKTTTITASSVVYGNLRGVSVYDHELANSYTGFQIACGSGTMTGGTIKVYGYRN